MARPCVYSVLGLLLLSVSVAHSAGWEWQNPLPQGNTLTDITFVDSLNGWAVGEANTILHTSDGGDTWQRQESGLNFVLFGRLLRVQFVNPLMGWVIALNDKVVHTTDAGATWIPQLLPIESGGGLVDVAFADENHGWILGMDRNYRTTNGGADWQVDTGLPGTTQRRLTFLDSLYGWVLLENSVAVTTDRGNTWTVNPIPDQQYVGHMDILDRRHGWVMGVGYDWVQTVNRTTDGGTTWITEAQPADVWELLQPAFADSLNGWAIEHGQSCTGLRRTSDAGHSWQRMPLDSTEMYLLALTVINHRTCWAVGGWGRMISATLDSEVGVDQWQSLLAAELTDVACLDTSLAVAVGRGESSDGVQQGVILRTTDGGDEWEVIDQTLPAPLRAVAIVADGQGWAVGDSGLILYSTNAGASWTPQTSPCDSTLLDVAFVDDQWGWAVGQGVVLRTTDGGGSWAVQYRDSTRRIRQLSAISRDVMWAPLERNWAYPGQAGQVLHTDDGGATWQVLSLPGIWNTGRATAVCFLNAQHGFVSAVHDDGYHSAFETLDGGVSWTYRGFTFGRMSFSDADRGWMLRDDLDRQEAYQTTDGGATWTVNPLPITGGLEGMVFADSAHGWVVGWSGKILHYSGETWSDVDPETSPAVVQQLALAVYPNPFNPLTQLTLELPVRGPVQLILYDVLGRQVETLTDGVLSAGSHRFAVDGSRLASGVYFARVSTPEAATTRKLLLLK